MKELSVMIPEMKMKNIAFLISAAVAFFTVCGCSQSSDDVRMHDGRLSLSRIYSEDVTSRIRFNQTKKNEMKDAYEVIAGRWNMNFLIVAEKRNGPDTLK